MNLEETLQLFDLNEKEIEVYILLAKTSWCTVLSLSRKSKIKRTTLYNILESLMEKNFVERKIEENTTYYNVAPVEKIQIAIEKQKSLISKMQGGLQVLNSSLSLLANSENAKTSVRFYRGISGVESVEWRAAIERNTETLILSTDHWHVETGREFAEKMRAQRVEGNASVRELLNQDIFIVTPPNCEVAWTDNKEYLMKFYRHRQIDKKILDISNETLICKDSIYFYSFDNNETIVIEINNKGYANMFRNLFELAWNQAEIKDNFGK